MPFTRRELCSWIAVISTGMVAAPASSTDSESASVLPSAGYPFEQLPVNVSANKVEMRQILKGKLKTGEALEVHETTLPPGGTSHPPHRHVHSEMMLIREGTVEFTVNGKSQRIGPGSVGFAASNDEHGVRNAGDTPATYFVVAVGPGAA